MDDFDKHIICSELQVQQDKPGKSKRDGISLYQCNGVTIGKITLCVTKRGKILLGKSFHSPSQQK